ncbi:MAG: bifunctional (p)ppGpp synthetase/guanosine-3',5'-bis(diphosphate) 3'-pyrophosphohydrolase [Bacteroides sp.]|nr:bifunctional (p)ppGpp synthetase/guanosine-3',5'-bis(diphosphate) 3'-pyrophosphohydrolase [Bacteroides sp.]
MSEEEEKEVARQYDELLEIYMRSSHRQKRERIDAAFALAREAHRDMRRRGGAVNGTCRVGGVPYILHPIAVARIVAEELGLGSTSIAAALLHDVIEHTDTTAERIRHRVDDKVAAIVEAVTRISGGVMTAENTRDSEEYRSLLLSMSSDIRVILVKMAERLHNMRTLGCINPEKQERIARETLFVYAPLAERLGLGRMKQQLEDLAFEALYPDEAEKIRHTLDRTAGIRERIVSDFMQPVEELLSDMGLTFEVKTRIKSAYSIFSKMRRKGIPLEEIFDIYALRIIFDAPPEKEVETCRRIFSLFSSIYEIHPDRVRDWTTVPKSNGYRAMHLTCLSPSGEWVEVQIRSRRMDDLAERGCAAHWQYKTDDNPAPELDDLMETIREVLSHPGPEGMDRLDSIRLGLRAREIYLFTHAGHLLRLPAGSTVADLARVTEPGRRCLGAKINHRLFGRSAQLESGDRVELITVENPAHK